MPYLIPYAPKDGKLRRLVAFSRSRIVKAPMDALSLTWKDRAAFICVVANCDYIIKLLAGELGNGLGTMPRDVNS